MINFIVGLLIGICIGALIMAKVTLKILDSIDNTIADWQLADIIEFHDHHTRSRT